jgi:hypothetical protein
MTPISRRREREREIERERARDRKERYEETAPGAFALELVKEEMQERNATEEARNTMPLDTSLRTEPSR